MYSSTRCTRSLLYVQDMLEWTYLPLTCTLDKTGDIHELNRCGNNLLGLAEVGQNLQTWVWHSYHANVGLYRAERKIRRLSFTILHLPQQFQILSVNTSYARPSWE